jgi:hypothetical protein
MAQLTKWLGSTPALLRFSLQFKQSDTNLRPGYHSYRKHGGGIAPLLTAECHLSSFPEDGVVRRSLVLFRHLANTRLVRVRLCLGTLTVPQLVASNAPQSSFPCSQKRALFWATGSQSASSYLCSLMSVLARMLLAPPILSAGLKLLASVLCPHAVPACKLLTAQVVTWSVPQHRGTLETGRD